MRASTSYSILIIAVCALCTFGERLLPFLIFGKHKVPRMVRYLGRVLPMAIMTAVDHGGDTLLGAGEEGTGHGGKIQPADLGEHVNGVVCVGVVQRDGLRDDGELFAVALVGQAAASAGHVRNVRAGERAEDCGGGCCIANAHLADAVGGEAVSLGLAHGLDAIRNGLQRFASQHGGTDGEIIRAVPDFSVAHGGAMCVG